MAEAVAPFHDLNDATTHQQRWVEAVHPLTPILNAALGDLAPLGTQQIRDSLERGGLPSPVGPEESDNRSFGHFERHAFQYQDDVVVDHFDITDLEHRGALWLHASPFLPGVLAF